MSKISDKWRQRLCKWRTVFAGWQLGTRLKGDPESDAVRDHRELTMLLRCEQNATLALLVKKGLVTVPEYEAQCEYEAEYLCTMYEKKFPGFAAEDNGISIDTAVAAKTTAGWRP